MNGEQKTILLVEDDTDVREYLAEVLEKGGFHVLVTPNAGAALDLLRRGEPVDLLLTDIRMPGVNGVELSRRAAAVRPGLKMLFVSGYAGDLATGLDAARLISKPVRPETLLRRIEEELIAL